MRNTNSKRPVVSLIFVGIIALLFWSELIFSNLPSLADVAVPAETLGWRIGTTRLYFLTLLLLDIVGGVGAILTIRLILKPERARWSNTIVSVTAAALIVYGLFQFIVAFWLPQNLQAIYWGIGIAYSLMGIILRVVYQRFE